MDDNKITIFLNNRGIDPSVPLLNLNEEILEELKQRDIYRATNYNLARIHYSVKGQKKELIMKNCILENMNFSQVQVSGKCVFYNCQFINVKFSKCTFPGSCFYECSFIDTMIIDSSLKSSLFINNSGLEDTDIANNNLDGVKVIGNNLDKNILEDHNNKIEDLYIRYEQYMGISKEVIQQDDEKADQKLVARNIIENKVFQDKELGKEVLQNTLFNECQFINCHFNKDINLDATTDFFKCSFQNMEFHHSLVQKVAFDHSEFDHVLMDSHFLHCSFVDCFFKDMSFSEDTTFKSCNFSYSNATDIFDVEKMHIDGFEFQDRKHHDEKLDIILQNLYELLKERDAELQNKIKLLDKDGVTRDIMIDYMIDLDDRSYIDFITDVGAKRKANE
ncbi:pentapeptide repeat-containing protein [Catenibacterium mitsuokai]|uniref:pentapeptide repeat-containing protein n=1 Tax=Catenibacterium mitsuokai TaxID=100886 RepID=UPI0022E18B6A|nr:pentapeptide repeat-containing protein [Catenibacterium mitsuokai]